jgi:hypothetical protein
MARAVALAAIALLGALLNGCSSSSSSESETARQPDTRFLPDHSQVICTVRVDAFLESPAGQEVVRQISQLGRRAESTFQQVAARIGGKPSPPKPVPPPPSPREELEKEAHNQFGLALADIQELTFAAAGNRSLSVVVVRTKQPAQVEDVLGHLKKAQAARPTFVRIGEKPTFTAPEVRKVQAGGQTVHVVGTSAFAVPEARTVIYGQPELLGKILERNGPAQLPPHLRQALDQSKGSHTVTIALDGQRLQAGPRPHTGEVGPNGTPVPPLPEAAVVQLDLKTDINASFQLLFQDAGAADKFKTVFQALVAAPRGNALPPDVARLLGSVTLTAQANSVTGAVRLDGEVLIKVLAQFGTSSSQTFHKVGNRVGPAQPAR